MDVSVIIVNYKTSHLIADCLQSLIAETKGVSYEVFVVDNNSEPDFKEKIVSRVKGAQTFHFIALPDNIGFGCANNVALEKCSGRNVLFLNPDTIILNNAVKILSDFLDKNPQAGACGGNLFGADMKPILSFKRKLPGIEWEFDELLHNSLHKIAFGKNRIYNHSSKPFKVGYITGADLMVRRSVLKKTGSFNPAYFMYFEESDLCARIKKAGWEIFSVPEARIQHLVGQSFGGVKPSPLKTEMIEKSRNIYYRTNHGPVSRAISNSIYNLFLVSRTVLTRNSNKKDNYRLRLKYFKESKRGKLGN